MLILTRRVGETLMIGDDVTVQVLGVKGNQVRIGVNAPKDLPVHREEIYHKVQQEKDPNYQSFTGRDVTKPKPDEGGLDFTNRLKDRLNIGTKQTIGNRIEMRRKECGFTQTDLANSLGVTPQSVQQWEYDKTAPRGTRLNALQEQLRCTKEWILFGNA